MHRKQKIAPDLKQQKTALNLVMFRLLSRFNLKINRIKCHSRCPYNCNLTRLSDKEGKFHSSHMSERRKLCNAEKRPIFRQSIDTQRLSTQAPALLACVRQNIFVYGNRVFDVGNTLKESTANCVSFLQVLPQKTTLFECALCMPSPIVRILTSMPIPMYSFFLYVHKYVLGLHIL